MSESVEHFLDQQSEAGLSLGTGAFTLHSAKARAKLAQFAFPEPGLWVVKMVQAAVAAGAPWIEFKFLKREVQIRFENSQSWGAEGILKLILSASTPSDRPLMHLQAGLLAASCGINEKISWSCGAEQVVLDSDNCQVSNNDEQTGMVNIKASRPSKSLRELGMISSPVRYLFKQTAHEYKALVDRCRCSPIPVILDNYEIPRHYARPSGDLPRKEGYDSDSSTGLRQVLAIRPISHGTNLHPLTYPLVETQVSSKVEDLESKPHFSGTQFPPSGPVDGILVLHSALQYKSRVNFLIDGALVESCPLDHLLEDRSFEEALENVKEDFYLDIYLNTDASQLDLSHFQIKAQDMEPLIPLIVKTLSDTLQVIHDCCELPWKFRDFKMPKGNIKNMSAGEILGAGFLSMFIPHAIVIGGITLVASPIAALAKPHLDRSKAKKLKAQISAVVAKLSVLPY